MIFINLYSTLAEALSTRYSPNTSIYNHRGIQLMPNSDIPYVQNTNVPDGIELEDPEVFAVSLCGQFRTDITDYFFIDRVYADDNGTAQIDWSLKNLPELGYGLIYLEVNQLLLGESVYADTWYSNVFMVSDEDSEYTARIDYRDEVTDTMLSTQLSVYYWQSDIEDTLASYTEVGTGTRRTVEASFSDYETWDMMPMPKELALKLKALFKNTFVYFNLVRTFPFNTFEIPKLIAQENFVKFTFDLSFDRNDVYNPYYVAPIPDISPKIVFNEIQYTGNNIAFIYYSIYNFEPSYLVVERSTDGINWLSSPILDEGGSAIYGLQYPMGTQMQLRIFAPVENVASNILPFEVDVPNTISGVTAVFLPAITRWRVTVDYNMSYYEGLNVKIITKKNADNPITTTEPNDGSVQRNILGNPGDLVQVYLQSTDNTFQSEIITITLTL